jgi:ABC-type transporter Mla MlaB component
LNGIEVRPMVSPQVVDALKPGDHACLTFTDPDERLDIVAAFVHTGLREGHKVLCLTDSVPPERLPRELESRDVPAREAIRRGQLAVSGSDRTWLATGRPSARRMLDLLTAQLDQALREGYPVLRMTADMCWANRPLASIDQLTTFESEVGALFADGRLAAICQYDRDSFDAVTLAFATTTHSLAVAATVYHEDPILRICRQHSPPGIRVAGEIDFTRAEPLTQAIAESLRLDHHLHVNLSQLRYIDAACVSIILQAASSVPPPRRVVVTCRGLVHEMFTLVGAGDAPALRVQTAHGQP